MKTVDKAKLVIEALKYKSSVQDIKKQICNDNADWDRVSKKAYDLYLQEARKQRKVDEKTRHVIATSLKEINGIIQLNLQLLEYALSLPSTASLPDMVNVQQLISDMPANEHKIIDAFAGIIMSPVMRAQQKKGRFEHFPPFKSFVHIIESAVISYYRGNFIGSYLTLIPVVEGVLLRWLGYFGTGKKPTFPDLKTFFSNSYHRQPCPDNVLFHDVFSKACDKLLTEHLFKDSQEGDAYSNFNRHLAAHLLSDSQFATRENCVRLFLLLDLMSELYLYEAHCGGDPRFKLTDEDISLEFNEYLKLMAQLYSPERVLLGIPMDTKHPSSGDQ
ncbi:MULTISPECIES: hypothetical protein [Acinetobacter calcoaceticus/baumannii complex]|uniref:hypothetical protein n=1 Tax=Acinetobacter calcoaceticus/baumannii complex TaxID=909768 RepID=UPI000AD2DA27|nr:hypothetical protein [Acinetobacter pittii]MCK0913874.1 hypothetical protein [Acinetobacter pittii]